MNNAVPDINRAIAHHLVSSDDSTLARYARTAGLYPVRRTGALIVSSLHADSESLFEERAEVLLPVLERVANVYQNEFNSNRYAKELQFWSGAQAGDAVFLAGLRQKRTAVLLDTTITTRQRIDEMEQLLAGYEDAGYLPGVAICEHEIGNLLAETDKTLQQLYYRRALTDAETAGMFPMICQILGTLGHEAAVAGLTDSMFYYWDRSRRIAEQHKLPDYSARIYDFYARHYETEGRLALAHDLLLKAQEVCRNLKGGYRELRFVVRLIEFYNDLECWEVTGRLLPRAALLTQKVPDSIPAGTYAPAVRARLAQARYLMATGHLDDAEAVLDEIKPLARQQLQRDQYPRLLYSWSEDLMAGGYNNRAEGPVAEGLARSKEVNFPYLIPKFHLLRAELFLQKNDYAGALGAVADFATSTRNWPARYEREWIKRDVVVSKALLASGDADSAATTLESGMLRLESYLAQKDASTHGYLWLGQNNDLLRLLRDRTQADPVAAYGAELYWRGLYQMLGAGTRDTALKSPGGPPELSLDARLRALAVDALVELSRSGDLHVVFGLGADRVVRLTAGPDGVKRENLAVPVQELERIVSDSWRRLSEGQTDPLAPVNAELATMLRALTLQLLPTEVRDTPPGSPRHLYISADGFLSALPFETLNLASDGSYVPLLARWDVVYLRRTRSLYSARPSAATGGLLVANPALSPETRRRLSVSEPLPGASREITEVAAKIKNANVLDGAEATKPNVVALWESVPLVYIAAHFLVHPEIPFLTLLPLAATDVSASPDAALIDIGDIRAADLAGCNLVVLSGCATGAPYISRTVTGPSFGDAVLDAGAGQVIQTFWNVGDNYAQRRVSEFFRLWLSGNESPERILNRVRRNELETSDGPVHPHFWAAFHVKQNHL